MSALPVKPHQLALRAASLDPPSLLLVAEVVVLVEVVKPVEPAAVVIQELEPFLKEKNTLPTSGRGFLQENRGPQDGATHIWAIPCENVKKFRFLKRLDLKSYPVLYC